MVSMVLFSPRSSGKVSQHLLRAYLKPKGSVGGQGSPSRYFHEAAQVLPHFLLKIVQGIEHHAVGGINSQHFLLLNRRYYRVATHPLDFDQNRLALQV